MLTFFWALCGSGKTVATYQPSMDMGAYVVIINAEKVVVTGNKFTQKVYTRHTGRPGSRKEETFQKLQAVRGPAACRIGLGCLRLHLLVLAAARWEVPVALRARCL